MSLDVSLLVNRRVEIYSANITHNLGGMAREAGLYNALWRPEEIKATHARELIPILQAGLAELVDNPDKYRPMSPENGWGSYEGLVKFTRAYLEACEENPDAEIEVDR